MMIDREHKNNRLQGTYRYTVPRTETGQCAIEVLDVTISFQVLC